MLLFDNAGYTLPPAIIVFLIGLFVIAKTLDWFLRKNGIITVIALLIACTTGSILAMGLSTGMILLAQGVLQVDMDLTRVRVITSSAIDLGGDAILSAALLCGWMAAKDKVVKESASVPAGSS